MNIKKDTHLGLQCYLLMFSLAFICINQNLGASSCQYFRYWHLEALPMFMGVPSSLVNITCFTVLPWWQGCYNIRRYAELLKQYLKYLTFYDIFTN